MDYVKYISTPKKTYQNDPKRTTLTVTRGRLTTGAVYFPTGPAGLLYIQARVSDLQILPYNRDEALHLNACVFPFRIDLDLSEPPYIIDILTWNTSTENPHALTISFSLDPWKQPRKSRGLVKSLFQGAKGYHKR